MIDAQYFQGVAPHAVGNDIGRVRNYQFSSAKDPPWAAQSGNKALLVAFFCIILSMYGGGFATVPAYLADVFGTQFVGAIHGRLLTAWSTAGIVGPVVVNYIREFEIAAGVPRDHVYDVTMYVLAAMLAGGFVCNLLIKPVDRKFFMTEAEMAEEKRLAHERAVAAEAGNKGSKEWLGLSWG